MNKLPAKQIYLLIVIIVGIIILSAYSTYAIFTLESETDNIVSINTPNSITLNTKMYEYKQVIVPKNSYIDVDIDLYNNTNDNLCYGIWYKIISTNLVNENKIKIYENTDNSPTTSGVINTVTSKRVNILIVNDNDTDAKINIGLSYENDSETCSLNLTSGKSLITSTIDSPKKLSDTIINELNVIDNNEGYLTYKNNSEFINISNNVKLYVATNFTYKEELFTLTNPEEIDSIDLINYLSTENNIYYTCLETNECNKLYRIYSVKETENEKDEDIIIDKYDLLVGYLSGKSGLKKINNNYIYFGDNPHNFIYYNCKNDIDVNTCELWRIMGFYHDEETNTYLTKIIKDSSLGTYTFNSDNNIWNNSTIANYLNKEYQLIGRSFLTEITFHQETIITNDNNNDIISYLPDNNKSFVTIMNLSDYLNASICENKNIFDYDSDCLNNNWLNKNNDINEYTMTIKYEMPTQDPETNELTTPENNIVYSVGSSINETNISEFMHIRPVVYLKSRILLVSGDGTIDNPYIIK